ncbi:MAG: nucleotidyl transferase AbiEii/AbiGii toxin family protein [Bacteroidales bacterium]|nr:nucleotidyl transferase AbiEii/AbiGii toxin family protein [Bacteroidales bacterium]
MLNLDQIKSYFPESLHGFERFMVREFLQYKILEVLYDSPVANKMAFIGGTALRMIYENNRFSEDLDFDNFDLSKEEFDNLTNRIKKKIELEGYQIETNNIYKEAFHCIIRFPGILLNLGLSGYREEKIMIRLDTESQHFDFKPQWKLLNKFDVFTQIAVTPPDILLSQKLYAIINRKRNKGRDFYDVVFLLGKSIKPNFNYLCLKLNISNRNELKQRLKEKLSEIDFQEMANDVRPFLFNTNDVKKVISFKEYILQIEF